MEQSNAMMMAGGLMPAMRIEDVIGRRNLMVSFVKQAMTPGTDYGKIPGTDKDTLLKPGAEKLNTLFALSPKFIDVRTVEDWTGAEHDGEPFFYYWQKCQLLRDGVVVGEGDGSCNSWEKKYRYRDQQRTCPNCGKNTIIKGKEEYGGGWICFAKKGGCGAKFAINAEAIVSQPIGQIVNPDICDQVNTLLKMAQKRALVAATLIAVNASEFFTQDIEDMYIEGEARVIVEKAESTNAPVAQTRANPPIPEPTRAPLPADAVPSGPGVQTHNQSGGNGKGAPKAKRALVQTGRWTDLLKNAITQGYVPDGSDGSAIRLLNVIGAAGIASINDLNLKECWAAIEEHYEAKAAKERETQAQEDARAEVAQEKAA